VRRDRNVGASLRGVCRSTAACATARPLVRTECAPTLRLTSATERRAASELQEAKKPFDLFARASETGEWRGVWDEFQNWLASGSEHATP
jgi:hypothetical protein